MKKIIVFILAFFAILAIAKSKQLEEGEEPTKHLEFGTPILSVDSVCVNPSKPIKFSNKLIRQTDKAIRILNTNIDYKSNNIIHGEFAFSNPDVLKSQLPDKDNFLTLDFEYSPKNMGWDIVKFTINYEVEGQEYISSFTFAGYGVKQDVSIVDVIGAKLSKDTIFVDDIRVGDSKEYRVILENNSNFPYGVNEQSILKEQINQNEDAFIFEKFFLPSAKHLPIGGRDTAVIRFYPRELKTYVARIVINSDISVRDIKNINQDTRQNVFYIKARGVAPLISLSLPKIEFNTVVATATCPTVKDTSFTIYNKGTQTLRINAIKVIEDFADMPFQFDNNDIEIPPNSSHTFNIKLNTDKLQFDREYTFNLYLKNNSINIPELTLPLSFSVNRMPALDFYVPEQTKSRTGRIIDIPILTDKNRISNASSFSATLTYNKDILEFDSYSLSGTASVSANNTTMLDTGITSIFISCKVENNHFLPLDTLIKLRFRTYLAETNTSQLVLSNCTVGNEYCPNLYEISARNGEFIIDSIPGLNLKLQRNAVKPIVVKSLFPNPAFDKIFLNLSAENSHTVHIELLNSASALVNKLSDISLNKGSNSIEIDINQFPAGAYYLKLYYDNYTELLKFNIVK